MYFLWKHLRTKWNGDMEKLRSFGQSTPWATKNSQLEEKREWTTYKYILSMCVFSSSILEREMQNISSSVPNSPQYKAKLSLPYPHN